LGKGLRNPIHHLELIISNTTFILHKLWAERFQMHILEKESHPFRFKESHLREDTCVADADQF
jgi:hypothetical protein